MAHAGMNLNLINIAFYILFLSSLTICIFASPTIKREAGIEISLHPEDEFNALFNKAQGFAGKTENCDNDPSGLCNNLELPPEKKLSLHLSATGTPAHGLIGEDIGAGLDGRVVDISGHWSMGDGKVITRHVVAKLFRKKTEAWTEIENAYIAGELVDFGVEVRKSKTKDGKDEMWVWAIMHWKEGKPLKSYPSFKAMWRDDREKCKAYMQKARDAVWAACKPYLKRKGAPYQKDMHQHNALIWFENEGEEDMKFFASIVDWQRIEFGVPKGTLADKQKLDELETHIENMLEEGMPGRKPRKYDFSDDNNCFGM